MRVAPPQSKYPRELRRTVDRSCSTMPIEGRLPTRAARVERITAHRQSDQRQSVDGRTSRTEAAGNRFPRIFRARSCDALGGAAVASFVASKEGAWCSCVWTVNRMTCGNGLGVACVADDENSRNASLAVEALACPVPRCRGIHHPPPRTPCTSSEVQQRKPSKAFRSPASCQSCVLPPGLDCHEFAPTRSIIRLMIARVRGETFLYVFKPPPAGDGPDCAGRHAGRHLPLRSRRPRA
jgi:hypothetical protein